MGEFSKLVVKATDKWVSDRRVWELTEDLIYRDGNTTYIIPAGFRTDFASAPRIPGAWEIGGDVGHRAAVLHDYLYTHHSGMTRAEVDDLFRRALQDDGVSAWRAWLMWLAVRMFGSSRWR